MRHLFFLASASLFHLFYLPSTSFSAEQHSRHAPRCSLEKYQEIVAKAQKDALKTTIDCSFTLKPGDTITKQLLFLGPEASNVTLDCRNGVISSPLNPTVFIKSEELKKNGQKTWHPPHNVTVKNCTINGTIRVQGMAVNGEDTNLRLSSYHQGHTERAKANAPNGVLFDNVTIKANGGIPLYISPGGQHVHLRNSTIKGTSLSVAIYMDAESAHNIIENSTIALQSRSREQIAIDGSANNKIIGNRFNNLARGGIYLYRNCGEGGTVRHQAPQHNLIEGNTFLYIKASGYRLGKTAVLSNRSFKVPAVWLGSRHGKRNFCGNDKGYPFGSSISNRDFAQHNKVINNTFIRLSPKRMIENDDKHNVISGNKHVKR